MSLRIRMLSDEHGEEVAEEGYAGVNSLMIVPERRDLAAFSSRIFKIEPGGHTAMHSHDREHVALVVKGSCRVNCESEEAVVKEGGIVYIKSNAPHMFSNPSKDSMLILFIMNLYILK